MITQKTKLQRKVERLEKEVSYIAFCLREKKTELKNARAVLLTNPNADRRKFK